MIDKSNMRQVIIDSPSQIKDAIKISKNIKVEGRFKNIVICAMGGSALPGSILISLKNVPIPIYTHRDYNLPEIATKESLVICISYSGNTEETVSALKESVKRGFKSVAIATGGKLKDICEKNNILFIKIPDYKIQPRSATGFLFSALYTLLANSKLIKGSLMGLSEELEKLNLEKHGKEIAKKLIGKIPLVHSSNRFNVLARIWKIKFNENSKIPSFYNYFPELNHNEMVGLMGIKKSDRFHLLIIKDDKDHKRNIKRMELYKNIAEKKGIKADFIELKGKNNLLKIFSNIMLADWTSYYMALINKVDPTPVDLVEEFKKRLK